MLHEKATQRSQDQAPESAAVSCSGSAKAPPAASAARRRRVRDGEEKVAPWAMGWREEDAPVIPRTEVRSGRAVL